MYFFAEAVDEEALVTIQNQASRSVKEAEARLTQKGGANSVSSDGNESGKISHNVSQEELTDDVHYLEEEDQSFDPNAIGSDEHYLQASRSESPGLLEDSPFSMPAAPVDSEPGHESETLHDDSAEAFSEPVEVQSSNMIGSLEGIEDAALEKERDEDAFGQSQVDELDEDNEEAALQDSADDTTFEAEQSTANDAIGSKNADMEEALAAETGDADGFEEGLANIAIQDGIDQDQLLDPEAADASSDSASTSQNIEDAKTSSPKLLGFVVRTRNVVSGRVVPRPVDFAKSTNWHLLYSIEEIANPGPKYRACKERRTKVYKRASDFAGDYVRELETLSRKGKQRRSKDDAERANQETVVYEETSTSPKK